MNRLILILVVALAGLATASPPLRNSTSLVLKPSPPDDGAYYYDEDDDNNNMTLVKETLVNIQVSPPEEELDLAGVYMHQASKGIQTMLKDSTHILDPFVDFFKALFAHMPQPQRPTPSKDRRKLYII